MRIAILADIHGNLPALEAALADIDRQRIDRIVVAGDVVVGSPDSLACWERIKALRCPVLRGNHERYVFDLHSDRAPPEWHTPRFGPVHVAARQLGEAGARELAVLPLTLKFPDLPDVLFVHGSARNDTDLVFPYTSGDEIEPMFAGCAEQWLVRGHNHFAAVRLWRNRKIVTVGSVGLPLDGKPGAQYTVLACGDAGCEVEHRFVSYDIAAAVRRFETTGYLQEAGPMARLYQREVETAAFQIIPFLARYGAQLAPQGSLDLRSAVDRFCGESR